MGMRHNPYQIDVDSKLFVFLTTVTINFDSNILGTRGWPSRNLCGMLMSLTEDRSERTQLSPRVLSGRVKHRTLKRGCSQPKQPRPLSLSWLIWSWSRRGKTEFRPGVQQQPESGPMSEELCWEEHGPTEEASDCWGPILMPFASLWTSNKPCWIFLYISLAVLM